MSSMRRRLLAAGIAAAVLALAGPVAGAGAQVPVLPLPVGSANSGNQIGTAGCVGTNRPSLGGNNGSTSALTCGTTLSFTGPQIGQIANVVGPTIIGSPLTQVYATNGGITQVFP
jgi:hypothetical protein